MREEESKTRNTEKETKKQRERRKVGDQGGTENQKGKRGREKRGVGGGGRGQDEREERGRRKWQGVTAKIQKLYVQQQRWRGEREKSRKRRREERRKGRIAGCSAGRSKRKQIVEGEKGKKEDQEWEGRGGEGA